MPQVLKKKLSGIFITTISLVLSLAVAEAVVRIAAPQQVIQFRPDIWMPVDTLGWTFRPNVSARINAGDGWAAIYTDARGFRVGEKGRIEGNRRLALIGDSFVAAIQVDHEKTLAGLMERDLADVFHEPVEVWNTAVSGWDPPHYLIRVRQVLEMDDRIDLVLVVVYLGNDIVDWTLEAFAPREPFPRPQFRLPRALSATEWIDALARPLDSELRQRSQLYVMGRSSMVTLRMKLGLSTIYFPREYLAAEAHSSRWDNTANILAEIEDVASSHGVPTLFVLIPPQFQVDHKILDRHIRAFAIEPTKIRIDQPNDLLGRRLRNRGMRVMDLTPMLREAVTDGVKPYGKVDSHFSAEGHALTWSVIKSEVVALLRSSG